MASRGRSLRPAIDEVDMFPNQRRRERATSLRSEVDFVEVFAVEVGEDGG